MKVLFVGPTLYGQVRGGTLPAAPDLAIRGPAAQGDVVRAVRDGAAVIGLIDGRYEDVAAPWHKEILFAIQSGVTVLGGGSLGALRAAECDVFGMIGVGEIYEDYRAGRRVHDADVAQVHGPAELDFMPLSEPMVNIDATLSAMVAAGAIDRALADDLTRIARALFFKDLTVDGLIRRIAADRAIAIDALARAFRDHRVDQKQRDALALVAAMQRCPPTRRDIAPGWTFNASHQWRRFIETR